MIYLDNAATTKVNEEVIEAMLPWFTEDFYNPNSMYKAGSKARQAIENARQQVASLIGAKDPEQIIFTSGGSEGNSTVINAIKYLETEKKGIVISSVEHESIENSVEVLSKSGSGYQVSRCDVDRNGKVKLDDLEKILAGGSTLLVSVMFVNNETGAVNDICEISNLVHKFGALFHTDCVQALGTVPLDVEQIGCDFATFSSHKIHGPKGVGAIFVRNKDLFQPIIYGSESQEFGLRGGTQNVPGIVGFGKACELIENNWSMDHFKLNLAKYGFKLEIAHEANERGLTDCFEFNFQDHYESKILSIYFKDVDAETLIYMLDGKVAVSAGSACHALEHEPSRVLMNTGLDPERAMNTIRISFSRDSSAGECQKAARIIMEQIEKVRKIKEVYNENLD